MPDFSSIHAFGDGESVDVAVSNESNFLNDDYYAMYLSKCTMNNSTGSMRLEGNEDNIRLHV